MRQYNHPEQHVLAIASDLVSVLFVDSSSGPRLVRTAQGHIASPVSVAKKKTSQNYNFSPSSILTPII